MRKKTPQTLNANYAKTRVTTLVKRSLRSLSHHFQLIRTRIRELTRVELQKLRQRQLCLNSRKRIWYFNPPKKESLLLRPVRLSANREGCPVEADASC
jgi:hypothetical protein